MHHFEITPKAFANSSPGLELATTLGIEPYKCVQTLKGFVLRRTLSGLDNISTYTQGSRKLEPWARISQRLRRNFKVMHHCHRRINSEVMHY